MYQYKVIKSRVDLAEEEMNKFAEDGWRVINVSPNIAKGYGLVIVLEKETVSE